MAMENILIKMEQCSKGIGSTDKSTEMENIHLLMENQGWENGNMEKELSGYFKKKYKHSDHSLRL